jgi:hypothetical protein
VATSENRILVRFHIVFERRKALAFLSVVALLIYKGKIGRASRRKRSAKGRATRKFFGEKIFSKNLERRRRPRFSRFIEPEAE